MERGEGHEKEQCQVMLSRGWRLSKMLDSQSNATEAEATIVEGGYQAVTMVQP